MLDTYLAEFIEEHMKSGAKKFTTMRDVRRFLSDVVHQLEAGTISETKARAFGYLANIIRECIAQTELEELKARVAALEEETR